VDEDVGDDEVGDFDDSDVRWTEAEGWTGSVAKMFDKMMQRRVSKWRVNYFCGCHVKDRRDKALAYLGSDTMIENKGKTENKEGKKEKRRTQGK
jgi:hypothetical protein